MALSFTKHSTKFLKFEEFPSASLTRSTGFLGGSIADLRQRKLVRTVAELSLPAHL